MQELQTAELQQPEVLILGAGPGGLTAAYWLLKQGRKVVLLEKDNRVGGLMRNVTYGDFHVDLGYKHLYNRIPEVHALWQDLLGDDYRRYAPRTGILYRGKILERERSFKGLPRGMPFLLLFTAFLDVIGYQFRIEKRAADSLESHTYARRGRTFTRIFSQEFDERFKGIKWSELPAPSVRAQGGIWKRFYKDATKPLQQQTEWYHPAAGTGQIIDRLEAEIRKMGGVILLNTVATAIVHQAGQAKSVSLLNEGKVITLHPQYVISCLPLQVVAPLLGIRMAPAAKELSFKRGIVMVYLFLDAPVSFPHTSLHVSCPETKMTRITNYAAIGGTMVPEGKGCLCIEYFTETAAAMMGMSEDAIYRLAVAECTRSCIVQAKQIAGFLVLRSPDADPATSWEDYNNDPTRKALYDQVAQISNFYQINRTGTDKSTYAGLMAAKAILAGDKEVFDATTRPDVQAPWAR